MTDWRRTRLKYLASSRAGTWGTDPNGTGQDVYCVRAADFDRERLRVIPERIPLRSVDPSAFCDLSLRPGDIVLEKSGGGTDQPVGGTALFDLDVPAVCTNFAARLRPLAGVEPRFLNYLLASLYYAGVTDSLAKQTTGIANLDMSAYMATGTAIPSMAAQGRIANYLDAETARIDAAVAVRLAQENLLDERELALVSKKLVPPGCLTSRLRYMASIQSGLTVDAQRDPGPDAVTRPYLRVANVHADELVLDSVTDITVPRALADRCTLRPGDVLMTEGGDLDKLGRGTMWRGQLPGALHQNHVFAVRPVPRLLDPEYLALLTRTVHARAYFERTGSKTTGLASTSSEKILNLPVPALSLEAQRSLVREVTAEINRMRQLRSAVRRQIDLIRERRQALITAAVTGQLDIPGVAA